MSDSEDSNGLEYDFEEGFRIKESFQNLYMMHFGKNDFDREPWKQLGFTVCDVDPSYCHTIRFAAYKLKDVVNKDSKIFIIVDDLDNLYKNCRKEWVVTIQNVINIMTDILSDVEIAAIFYFIIDSEIYRPGMDFDDFTPIQHLQNLSGSNYNMKSLSKVGLVKYFVSLDSKFLNETLGRLKRQKPNKRFYIENGNSIVKVFSFPESVKYHVSKDDNGHLMILVLK